MSYQKTKVYIWFEDKEALNSWKSAEDDPQARDSASGLIGEFSPINLPFMDSKLRAKSRRSIRSIRCDIRST